MLLNRMGLSLCLICTGFLSPEASEPSLTLIIWNFRMVCHGVGIFHSLCQVPANLDTRVLQSDISLVFLLCFLFSFFYYYDFRWTAPYIFYLFSPIYCSLFYSVLLSRRFHIFNPSFFSPVLTTIVIIPGALAHSDLFSRPPVLLYECKIFS